VTGDAIDTVKRAAARTSLAVGIFLIVAGGTGYITASLDPVHTTADQLVLVAIGIALTAAGRIISTDARR
jgi:hypothetical protein